MKKIIWICGLIGGLISFCWFLVSEQFFSLNISLGTRMFFGYATMILGLSVIFVAVRNFRDNYNGGVISFGKGFRIGLLITLIASTLYVVVWLIDYTFFVPDFYEKYTACLVADLKANGASAVELKKKTVEMNSQVALYKKPLFNVLFTYLEIAPVGVVISVIAALILKKKPAVPALSN